MNYGCHNRQPLRSHLIVQDGWQTQSLSGGASWSRMPVMRLAEVPMTKDCQHTLDAPNDKKCKGCRWQA